MFEAFVITLREGVEAALVLAIAASLLRRRGLASRIPALLGGAGVALLFSAGLSYVASRLTYNEEIAEGVAMLVGAVFVLSLVWWMWKSGSRMKQEIEAGLDRVAGTGFLGGVGGVALFGFAMVLREGFETAVFLSAAGFNSSGLLLWVGALGGLVLAAVFGVLFARGAIRVPLKPFFSLTSAVLLLFAFQLLVGGLHELSEGQLLPSSRAEMAIVGPLIKNELLLFTLTVALALGWLLLGAGRTAAPAEASGPQARLARAASASDARWRRSTALVGLLVVAALAVAFVARARVPAREPATALAIANGSTTIDTATLADRRMHYYETALSTGAVRFFAVQVGDEVKTCLDACEICGDIGYFLDGGTAVCRNCTSPIPLQTLGRTGGCNPIPLPHTVEGGRVVVSAEDLAAAAPRIGRH